MNDSKTDKNQQASALLALALKRESAAYAAPSDEELAVLLEIGMDGESAAMDATRRSQIMDSIANDAETFNRWMSLVEAADTLELAGFASEASAAQDSERSTHSVASWFKSFFSNPFKGFATAGGGLVAASALMLMVTTTDNYQSELDQLYGDYGSSWQSNPAPQTVTRSAAGALKKKLEIEDLLLREGVVAGLEKLGPEFELVNLASADSDNWSDEIDRELENALDATGQIAAMSYFKCSLGAEEAYFEHAYRMIKEIQPTLANGTGEPSKAISKSLQRDGDAETQVCRLSKLVIDRITY